MRASFILTHRPGRKFKFMDYILASLDDDVAKVSQPDYPAVATLDSSGGACMTSCAQLVMPTCTVKSCTTPSQPAIKVHRKQGPITNTQISACCKSEQICGCGRGSHAHCFDSYHVYPG